MTPRDALPLLLSLLAVCAAPAHAQHSQPLPGASAGQSAAQSRTEFQRAVRGDVSETVQDWVNLMERGDAESLAHFYTERALLVRDAEARAWGRGAVREAWAERLPAVSGVAVELTDVIPGTSFSAAMGRLTYDMAREGGGADYGSQGFLMVFHNQRGRWLLRQHVLVPDTSHWIGGQLSVLKANQRRADPPERVMVRLVGELGGGQALAAPSVGVAAAGVAGGGLGLELGRSLEVRGQAWQQMGEGEAAGEDPLRAYGGELRLTLLRLGRLEPQLMAGAVRYEGAGAPDTAVVPVAGGGLALRLTPGMNLQLAARSHLPQRPEVRSQGWMSAPRDQHWLLSGGLSVALGRRPVWRDPVPTAEQTAYLSTYHAGVSEAVERWAAARGAGDLHELVAMYALDAQLLHSAHGTFRGRVAVNDFLARTRDGFDGLALQVTDLVASDGMAVVGGRTSSRAGEDDFVMVLQQRDGGWRIRAQAFYPAP